ncbi:MAG: leucine-rich repeat protein [Bacillota bacterium]
MKKSLFLLVSVLFLLFPAGLSAAFTDVPADTWYSDAVAWATENGVTNGTSETTFSPGQTCTRGQVVTFLWRAQGSPEPSAAANPFVDVGAKDYYYKAVLWAMEEDITNGTSETEFSPKAGCTRAQVAAFLHRSEGSPDGGGENPFSDVKSGVYYYDAVLWAVEEGITNGTSETEFSPKASCTRAQIVTFLWRAYDDDGRDADWDEDDDWDDDDWEDDDVSAGGAPDLFEEIYSDEPDPEHVVSGTLTADDGKKYEGLYVDDELIVDVRDDAGDSVWELLAEEDAEIVGWIEELGLYQVRFDEKRSLAALRALAERWKKESFVEDAYLNTVSFYDTDGETLPYPNDPWDIQDKDSRWSEDFPAGNNWGYEAICAPTARRMVIEQYKESGKREGDIPYIDFCVIDTMFEAGNNGEDGHEDVRVYPVMAQTQKGLEARSAAKNAPSEHLYEQAIHGTHVAGILGAVNDNGFGGTGVNIHSRVSGYALYRNEKNGALSIDLASDYVNMYRTTSFEKITVIMYVLKAYGDPGGAPLIVNYSVGQTGAVTDAEGNRLKQEQIDKNAEAARADNIKNGKRVAKAMETALKRDHIDFLIVSAAGNGSDGAEERAVYNNEFNAVSEEEFPEVYRRVLVVGATRQGADHFYFRDGFSYGDRVDVAAPGTDIYGAAFPNDRFNAGKDDYRTGGTSMAAPHAAGIAGLLLAADPKLTGPELKTMIKETANIRLANTDSHGTAHNMVNAAAAVAKAQGKTYAVGGTLKNGLSWKLTPSDGAIPDKLTVTGKGAIAAEEIAFGAEGYPWERWRDNITAVEIGEGVTAIGERAFCACLNLESVQLPKSLTAIGDEAFYKCVRLTSLEIPASVTAIGDAAAGMYRDDQKQADAPVKDFTVYGVTGSAAQQYADRNGLFFVDIGDTGAGVASGTFGEGGALRWTVTEDGELIIGGKGEIPSGRSYENDESPWYPYRNQIVKITVLRGVTAVGAYAFRGCGSAETITLPRGVTSLYSDAFRGLKSLNHVNIPDTVTYLGSWCFADCSALESISVPGSVGAIPNACFIHDTSLKSAELGEGIVSIGTDNQTGWAFYGCSSLAEITLPASVRNIYYEGFAGCTSLKKIVVREGLEGFGQRVFWCCSALKEIWWPKSLTGIGSDAFSHVPQGLEIHYAGSESDWNKFSHTGLPNPYVVRYSGQ